MNENDILIQRDIIRNEAIPAAVSVELGEHGFMGEDPNESTHGEWLEPLIMKELTPKEDANRKRIIATAIIKGIREGAIESMSAPDIASLIDEGITRMTVAHQVGDGQMDSVEAMDVLIDHAAVRVITIADDLITKVEKGLLKKSDIIADTLVDQAATGLKVLASAFPPTRVLVPFIDTIAQYIKPIVRTVVKKGITIIANVARTVVKKVVPFIAEKVKQGFRSLKRLFSRLLSF